MPSFVAANPFDMSEFIASGSLSEFFDFGDVVTATDTDFVVTYADETISEQLTLGGTFGAYVDGYPTTGVITSASYSLNGGTLFTFTDISITVEEFTAFVSSNDLAGLFAVLLGGDDTLIGSSGDDVLNALEGNDFLDGGNGNDTLRGGFGNDELVGGEGNDFLSEGNDVYGPFGDDIYNGGAGIDRVSLFNEVGGVTVDLRIQGIAQNTGPTGNDTLIGIEHLTASHYNDVVTGNDEANWLWTFSGDDTVSGNGGDDLITTGWGTKNIDGGDGIDILEVHDSSYAQLYTTAGVVISLLRQGGAQEIGIGSFTLTNIENLSGSFGTDTLIGDGNANILAGESGNDRLYGGAGNDTLAGDGTFGVETSGLITFIPQAGWATGDDLLEGGLGDDLLFGGTGIDTATYANATGAVIVSLIAAVSRGAEGNDSLVGIENVIGSAFADTLTGGNESNTVTGGAGNDVIDGRGGADSMRGGTGNDVYYVDDAGDRAIELAAADGSDVVRSTVTFTLGNHVEQLVLSGAAAINGTGNSLNNLIYGNAANNSINGGGGADSMRGGAGNDIYYADNAGDRIVEGVGGGIDQVRSSVDHTLGANIETLILSGAALRGNGNDLANTIYGNDAANIIDGRGGADSMRGGAGNDTYTADNGGDRVIEAATGGIDRVNSHVDHVLGVHVENLVLYGTAVKGYGNDIANSITGNALANVLDGRGGNDVLSGGTGNDRIHGGLGNDRLTGGEGADRFYFDTALSSTTNVDRIIDFNVADDSIMLDLTIFSALAGTGTLSAAAFATGTAAADADDRILYDSATGRIYYDADGNGAGAAVLFAQAAAGLALTSSDFIGVA